MKRLIEANFAESVKQQAVQLHSTRYSKSHDQEGRAWISIGKEEVYDFCTFRKEVQQYKLQSEIQLANNTTDFRNPAHKQGYYRAIGEAEYILHKRGIYSQYEFYNALEMYLSSSIEESLESENLIIKSLSLLDKRLGKRRLRGIQLSGDEHPLIKRLYDLRCKVENIKVMNHSSY